MHKMVGCGGAGEWVRHPVIFIFVIIEVIYNIFFILPTFLNCDKIYYYKFRKKLHDYKKKCCGKISKYFFKDV